jgi:hypothetical protein
VRWSKSLSIVTMDRLAKGLCYLIVTTASLVAGPADLAWDAKEIHLKATPSDKEVVARYGFRNEGKEAVKFKSFASTCGCVAITVSTMVVPPGAKGDVTVTFAPEFRIGTQRRPIAIQFDDEERTKMALYLIVEIPEIVRPQPAFLKWGEGEAMERKSVTIVTDEKYPVESIRVLSSHPSWKTKVTPLENSRNYALEVLPRRGPAPQGQYVEVEAKLADGQTKRANLYVVVR